MAETIESFVQKLQTEGVQAGKQAADTLLADARRQAEQIVQQANAQGEEILAEARRQAQAVAEQQQNELDLAVRGMVLRLRDAVSASVNALLQHEVAKKLEDGDFLTQLIHDVVVQYAGQDARHEGVTALNVNPDLMDTLTDWALKYLGKDNVEEVKARFDLRSTLKSRGFEYAVAGYTVEVTVDSIVEVLKQNMTPQLRETLDRAVAGIVAETKQA